jgi:hypothetical protein
MCDQRVLGPIRRSRDAVSRACTDDGSLAHNRGQRRSCFQRSWSFERSDQALSHLTDMPILLHEHPPSMERDNRRCSAILRSGSRMMSIPCLGAISGGGPGTRLGHSVQFSPPGTSHTRPYHVKISLKQR